MLRNALTDRKSFLTLVAWIVYFPVMAASDWIRSRLQFADPPSWGSKRMARLLHIPGHTYVEVANPSATATWYVEKLGLRRLAPSENSDPKTISLKFSYDATEEMRLGPHDSLSLGGTVILYSRRLKRTREVLRGRGIDVGPIQFDRQGTSYFEFHDPEGNTVEVCNASIDS
jgi:catechol 2,3-dioxygenase-like lactoylglutathione lyase family enzyme